MIIVVEEINYSDMDFIINKASMWERVKEFEKVPKVVGNYRIALLLDLKSMIKIVDEVINDETDSEYFIKAKSSKKKALLRRFPKLQEESLNSFERFENEVVKSGISLTASCKNKLFKSTQGDKDYLAEILNKLKLEDNKIFDTKDISKYLYRENIVYAREVVTYALLRYNKAKLEGKFARYRWFNLRKAIKNLELAVGEEAAFYAGRKAIRDIYKSKVSQLEGKEGEYELEKVISLPSVLKLMMLYNSSNFYTHLPLYYLYERSLLL